MKRGLFQALALTGVMAVAGAVSPISAAEQFRVKIPFSFLLAGKAFSPGDYRIDENNNGLVVVQGAGQAAAVLSVPTDYSKTSSATGLRFTGMHQLVGLQVEGEVGRAIPAGYHEHKLAIASH